MCAARFPLSFAWDFPQGERISALKKFRSSEIPIRYFFRTTFSHCEISDVFRNFSDLGTFRGEGIYRLRALAAAVNALNKLLRSKRIYRPGRCRFGTGIRMSGDLVNGRGESLFQVTDHLSFGLSQY